MSLRAAAIKRRGSFSPGREFASASKKRWLRNDKLEMDLLSRDLVKALCQQIILYKSSILTPARRTPMYSGYFISRAFIVDKLSDYAEVTRYLIANGIQMD